MEGSRTTEVSEGCCRFGCKRWLVFLTAWLSMAIDVGFIFSSGALFVEYMNTFQVNRSQASLVQSVMMAVRFGSGVMSGAIVQRFGTMKAGLFGSSIATVGFVISFFATSIYHLVFSMGVLIAIGSSCLFISSSTAVGRHFSGKTGLILMSIQTAGGGLGGMLYPFILKYLNSAYGLKGSLLLMGGFYMQLIPASLLWTDSRKDTNTHSTDVSSQTSDSEEISELIKDEDNNSKNLLSSRMIDYEIERKDNHECNILIERQIHITDASNIPPKSKDIDTVENINEETAFENLKHLATTPSFALFAAGLGIAYPSLGIVFIFIVDLFMDAGLTKDQASLGLFLIHMFSILGRLLPGIIMQSKHVATLSVPIVAATMTSVSMAGLAYANVSELCLFLCCFIGIPYGMFVSVFSVTPLKLVGISRLSNAIGVLFTLNGLGTALAGPISGMLRDSLGSYRIPFLMAASTLLAGGLLFCISLYLRKKSKRYITESNLC